MRGIPRPKAFIWLGVVVNPGGGGREWGTVVPILKPSNSFVQLFNLFKKKITHEKIKHIYCYYIKRKYIHYLTIQFHKHVISYM